jgi:hypothetical protein
VGITLLAKLIGAFLWLVFFGPAIVFWLVTTHVHFTCWPIHIALWLVPGFYVFYLAIQESESV